MNGENSLRDILPLLRPRSAEPTLFGQIVWYVLWIGLAALPIAYLIRWIRLRRRRQREFNLAAQSRQTPTETDRPVVPDRPLVPHEITDSTAALGPGL